MRHFHFRATGLYRWFLAAVPLVAFAQVTESPRTVAPGRVLVRMDGLRLSFDRADAAGNTYDAAVVASTTVRTGLTETVDFQLGLDAFVSEIVKFRGTENSRSGMGDLSLRAKWAFWRAENSGASVAVMPYVRLPTGSGRVGGKAVEGGIIVPWAIAVGDEIGAGAMVQWELVRNPADSGYDPRWFVSAYARRDFSRAIAVYFEATGAFASGGSSEAATTMGLGALWRIAESFVFDYELQRGLGRRAAEWTHTWRLNWEW